MNIDDAKIKFDQFLESYEDFKKLDLSEADTRSKVIDALLIDVLGWKEADLEREGHVDSGYYDYKISIPGINLIVEAKKQYQEIAIPKNHKKVLISTIYSSNKELIDQIRKYGIDSGVQFGLITNGKQFILLKLFNNDGIPWKENHCLVFNGVSQVDSRFVEFYENLSKFSVINNGGFNYDYNKSNVESTTILSTLINRDKELIRNQFSAHLTPLIDSVFGEVFSEEKEDDKDFIEKCFVTSIETKKNKSEIQKIFEDKAPELSEVIPAIHTDSIKTQIQEFINSDDVTIRNQTPPKPIIVIGSKGAGKTTFINYLFKYELDESDISDHFTVYIDLRKFYEVGQEISSKLISTEILNSLQHKYQDLELHSLKVLKRIYINEIRNNDESIWLYDKENDESSYNKRLSIFLEGKRNDSFNHLCSLSKYLIRERRKRLLVIIDNGDQFEDATQERIFLFSHAFTKTALGGAVISLREGYYYKWRNSPPFDAYESNVYHITAANYPEVLQKRLDFALEKVEVDKELSSNVITQAGYSIEIDNGTILEFLSGLKDSLFTSRNTDLLDFLDYTTYPNIREGLRIFKQYLISGHTNVSEYIARHRFKKPYKDKSETIPFHEFVRAIGLHNKHYFNSQTSVIHNIFIPPVGSDDHFIKIYLLQYFIQLFEQSGNAGKFISYSSIIEYFSSLGYRINILNDVLKSMIKNNLLDTNDQLSDIKWNELPKDFELCVTSKGYYYKKSLIHRFFYLDLVLQDTPIFDKPSFKSIETSFPKSDSSGKRKINQRLSCVNKYLDYLLKMEQNQPNNIKSIFGSVVTEIAKEAKEEMKRIKNVTSK